MGMKEISPGLSIVRAQAFDAPKLSRIAMEGKRHWGYPEEWLEFWRGEITISPSKIVSAEAYCAMREGGIVGFYVLCDRRRIVELEHFWVIPKCHGQGIGRALFAHAVERAREYGFARFVITSDPNAAEFYVKMGARQFDTFQTEVQGCARELPIFVYNVA